MSLVPYNGDPLALYKPRSGDPAPERLEQLLVLYGLEDGVEARGEVVDIMALAEKLPNTLPTGVNPAHRVLSEYVQAIPPTRRVSGVYVPAEALIAVLLNRLEFFEGLGRNLVRICKGTQCPHFSVCDFAEVVESLSVEDRVPCAVEREVVRQAVEGFVTPTDGSRPKVDPRQPEQLMLFRELVELMVKKTRLSMYLQQEDMLIPHYEALKDGDTERFETANKIEHPLLAAWERTQNQILKVTRELGISPEFQIRQGLAVDENAHLDAERRAREIAVEMVQDKMREMVQQLPEGDPQRRLIEQALANSEV